MKQNLVYVCCFGGVMYTLQYFSIINHLFELFVVSNF